MKTRHYLMGLVAGAGALAAISLPGRVHAAPTDSTPIWRMQIEFSTADRSDAGTDDDVVVRLNGSNSTFVDSPADDFVRNTVRRHDLMQTGVRRVGDITLLSISKSGTDGWCLRGFRLLVNGRELYNRSFSTLPDGCHWLDGNDGHQPSITVSKAQLLAAPAWRAFIQPAAPRSMPALELRDRIEASVGHFMDDQPITWGPTYGPAAVELTRKDANTVDVDLDLGVDMYWYKAEVDVNFDLRVSCEAGRPRLRATNIRAEFGLGVVSDYLFGQITSYIETAVTTYVEYALSTMTLAGPTGATCLTVTVLPDASIAIK